MENPYDPEAYALSLAASLSIVSDCRMALSPFRALVDIYLNRGVISMKELSVNTSMCPATITGVADTLEKYGLIKRTPFRNDRRIIHIQTTPRGDAFMAEVLAAAPQKA